MFITVPRLPAQEQWMLTHAAPLATARVGAAVAQGAPVHLPCHILLCLESVQLELASRKGDSGSQLE